MAQQSIHLNIVPQLCPSPIVLMKPWLRPERKKSACALWYEPGLLARVLSLTRLVPLLSDYLFPHLALYVGCIRNLSIAIEGEADVARTTAVGRT